MAELGDLAGQSPGSYFPIHDFGSFHLGGTGWLVYGAEALFYGGKRHSGGTVELWHEWKRLIIGNNWLLWPFTYKCKMVAAYCWRAQYSRMLLLDVAIRAFECFFGLMYLKYECYEYSEIMRPDRHIYQKKQSDVSSLNWMTCCKFPAEKTAAELAQSWCCKRVSLDKFYGNMWTICFRMLCGGAKNHQLSNWSPQGPGWGLIDLVFWLFVPFLWKLRNLLTSSHFNIS